MEQRLLTVLALAGTMLWVCGCGANKDDDVDAPLHDDTTTTAITVGGVLTPKDGNSVESFLFVRDQDGGGLGVLGSEISIQESQDGVTWQPVPASVTDGTSETIPVAAALTMDYSGSMANAVAVSDMQAGVNAFIDLMRSDDTAEVVKFSTKVRMVQSFTSDQGALRNAVADEFADAGGMTALYDSIQRALDDTAEQVPLRVVVALTDGRENSSSTDRLSVIADANKNHVPVFTVGLGNNVHETDLFDVAENTGGSFYSAATSADLVDTYQKVSGVLRHAVRCQWSSAFTSGTVQTKVTITYHASSADYETDRVFTYVR